MNKRVQSPSESPSSVDAIESSFVKITSFISLAANIVTVVGLVIVVLQLYESQRMTRAQTRHELSSTIVTILSDTANNPQLASVIYRGSKGIPLTAVEQFQFELRSNALLRYWEDVHYQFRMGLYDVEEFDRHRGRMGRDDSPEQRLCRILVPGPTAIFASLCERNKSTLATGRMRHEARLASLPRDPASAQCQLSTHCGP